MGMKMDMEWHLLVGVGEGSDSFGHNQRHLVGRCGVNRVDKDAPRSILFYRLAPTVWPSKDNRVWFQSPQTGRLDPVKISDNLSRFVANNQMITILAIALTDERCLGQHPWQRVH